MSRSSHVDMPPLQAGAWLALVSATLFGLSTPLLRRFGQGQGPFMTAGLLYAGASIASLLPSRRHTDEASLRRRDLPRLIGVAVCGAVIAPACLAWGLARASAVLGSLLLASEAVFTVLLARIFYSEPVGARMSAALACIGGGSALLLAGAGSVSTTSVLGCVAVVAAAVAWAADNALTRPLADQNPQHVVAAKGALGAALSFALATTEHAPTLRATVGLLVTGALGYGVSLRFYLRAQRRVGAGRTASIFAAAPFIGAVAAWGSGEPAVGGATVAAGALVAAGLYLHLSERHGHAHAHVAMDHDHQHSHDDGHHEHVHDPPVAGAHSHLHHHEEMQHEHPHGPDVHHQHSHR